MTRDFRAAHSREFYLAYLNSPAWRYRRNLKLWAAKWRCERCDNKRDLHVHHKTYERLGAERDEDLEVLCADCHEAHHIQATDVSSVGVYLKLARQALRADPFASITDLSDATKQLCADGKISYDGYEVNRALELILGRRMYRAPRSRVFVHHEGDRFAINVQDARELLMRLQIVPSAVIRTMPTGPSPAELAAHEAIVRDQARAFLHAEPWPPPRRQRRNIYAVIEDIFRTPFRDTTHEQDAARREREQEEIRREIHLSRLQDRIPVFPGDDE